MKKYSFTVILLGVALLQAAGCSTPATPIANPTDTLEISASPGESPSPSPSPDLSRLSNRCVETFASIPQGIILKGVLVLDSPGSNNETYLWDLSSGDQEAIGSIYIWGLAVSPEVKSWICCKNSDMSHATFFTTSPERVGCDKPSSARS